MQPTDNPGIGQPEPLAQTSGSLEGAVAAETPLLPESSPRAAVTDTTEQRGQGTRQALLLSIFAVVLILLIAITGVVIARWGNKSGTSGVPATNQSVNAPELNVGTLQVGQADSLTVNGQLRLADTLVVKPSGAPANPVTGQIYYDKVANRVFYYNGTRWVAVLGADSSMVSSIDGHSGAITLGSGLQFSNGVLNVTPATVTPDVTSVNGQVGVVTLNAGTGIGINGTTITNTGVTSITSGSPNITVTSTGSKYTISETGGGFVTSPGGTAGTLALFTGTETIADSLLTQSGSTVSVGGTLSATNLEGDGSGVTNVDAVTLSGQGQSYYTNASNLSSGTLSNSRLSASVTLQGNAFNGANELVQLNGTAGLPALDGSLLTNLNASNIASGTLADARLSANVALLDATQTFSGYNTFKNATNADIGFQIQDALSSVPIFSVDTNNDRVGINLSTVPAYALDVNGDINSNTAVRIGGVIVCTVDACTPASGSDNYIQNSTGTQDLANFNIRSVDASSVTGVLEGAVGQTADILQVASWDGTSLTNLLRETPNGTLVLGTASDATGQLQFTVAGGGNTGSVTLVAAAPGSTDYTLTLPAENGTICTVADCAPSSGGGNYIQNQSSIDQTASFRIAGTGQITAPSPANQTAILTVTNTDSTDSQPWTILGTTGVNNGVGVYGKSGGATGFGVVGQVTASANPGVLGINGGTGVGVQGTNVGGTGSGVGGTTASVTGYGVLGNNTGGGYGVLGEATSTSSSNIAGVYGLNATTAGGYGVLGSASAASTTAATFGVEGVSVSTFTGSAGVIGIENNNAQVYGVEGSTNSTSAAAAGVFGGSSGAGDGVFGASSTGNGVRGLANGSGAGVYAQSSSGVGLYAVTNGTAVYAQSASGISGLFQSIINAGNTNPTLVAEQFSTSTADLFQVQNASGQAIDSFSSTGVLSLGRAASNTGTIKFFNSTGGSTGSISLVASNPSTTNYTLTLPAENGTLCTTAGSGACTAVYAPASGSANYIQNQNAGAQTSANFNISGTGTAAGGFIAGSGSLSTVAIQGTSNSSYGVQGTSTSNYGVYGTTTSGTAGTYGTNSSTTTGASGVLGVENGNAQVYGVEGSTSSTNANSAGVYGLNTGNGIGVNGASANFYGVQGTSTSSYGVVGNSTNYFGVLGETSAASGSIAGLYGLNNGGGPGVSGATSSATTNVAAIIGNNSGGGYGIEGLATSGIGVFGQSSTGISGFFQSSSGSNTTATLISRQNGSATGNLLEIQNASGNALDSFSSAGLLTLGLTGTQTGSIQFKNSTASSGSITLTEANTSASNYTLTLPSETGTICTNATGSSTCTNNYAAANGTNANYIQNQSAGSQAASFNISGTGSIGSSSQSGVALVSTSNSSYGVWGISTSNYGVYGSTTSGVAGIFADGGTTANGVYATTSTATTTRASIFGENTGNGNGVIGKSDGSGIGVYGQSTTGISGFFQSVSASNTASTLYIKEVAGDTGDADLLRIDDNSSNHLLRETYNGNLVLGTGSSSKLLILDGASSAPTEADGAMYYDTTTASFDCGVRGQWVSCTGLTYTALTTSSNVSGPSGTGQNGFSTGYVTLPANDCQAGVTYQINASGWLTYSATGITTAVSFGVFEQPTASSLVGLSALAGTGHLSDARNTGNHSWNLYATVTCRSSTSAFLSGYVVVSADGTGGLADDIACNTTIGAVTNVCSGNGFQVPAIATFASDTSGLTWSNGTGALNFGISANWTNSSSSSDKVDLTNMTVQRLSQ